MSATRKTTAVRELIAYFLLTYAITFVLGWMAVPGSTSVFAAGRTAAAALLHYGPALAALIIALAAGGRADLGDLLKPLGKWRVGWRWYLFVLFFLLAVRLLASGIHVLLGGSPPAFFVAGEASGIPSGIHPLVLLVPVFLGVLLQAGVAEEIGWRGFALPRLQWRMGALASSLVLAALWTLWHNDPSRAPQLLPKGLWYPLAVVPMTILMTWIYNSTGGSLLLMLLYHTASNTADWIVPTTDLAGAAVVTSGRPLALQIGLMWLAALVVIAVYGPRDLARRGRSAVAP